jgi:hypothetical protein
MKAPEARNADDALPACDPKERDVFSDKFDAARLRFSKLIEVIEAKFPEGERKQILHALGGKCADTYRAALIDRYKGKYQGIS